MMITITNGLASCYANIHEQRDRDQTNNQNETNVTVKTFPVGKSLTKLSKSLGDMICKLFSGNGWPIFNRWYFVKSK